MLRRYISSTTQQQQHYRNILVAKTRAPKLFFSTTHHHFNSNNNISNHSSNQQQPQNNDNNNMEWNNKIIQLCKNKNSDREALKTFDQMMSMMKKTETAAQSQAEKFTPSTTTILFLLNAAVRLRDLNHIFKLVPLILSFHIRINNKFLFLNVFKLCGEKKHLSCGQQFHKLLLESEYRRDPFIKTALLVMYNKCGQLDLAQQVFREMVNHKSADVVTWNSMISALRQNQRAKEALQLFREMEKHNVKPNDSTFVVALTSCADVGAVEMGEEIAKKLASGGGSPSSLNNILVKTALLNMYSKCGKFDRALSVFHSMKSSEKDIFVWCSMLSSFQQHGRPREALNLFEEMRKAGVKYDETSFVIALAACADLGQLSMGQQVAKQLSQVALRSPKIQISLVTMYSKCGDLKSAFSIFEEIKSSEKDVSAWNAMLSALRLHDKANEALDLFNEMKKHKVTPDSTSYVIALSACADLAALDIGREIARQLTESPSQRSTLVRTALLNMYSKCGDFDNALAVFETIDSSERDVSAWNAMLTVFRAHGKAKEALNLFDEMKKQGVTPDTTSYVIALSACADLAALDTGREIAQQLNESTLRNTMVRTALLSMYSKCNDLDNVISVFEASHVSQRDVSEWNTMLSAFRLHGKANEALNLFNEMMKRGVTPDSTSYVIALSACADLAALDIGRKIALQLTDSLLQNISVRVSLLSMYSKCGDLNSALAVFGKIESSERSVVAWNSMMAAYGQHGKGREALQLFDEMQNAKVKPDEVTFVVLLNACSHVGLVEEALHLFKTMESIYNIKPNDSHIVCIVDVLGRIGRLDEAENAIAQMKGCPGVSLRALLGACRSYKDVTRAERVFERIMSIDSSDASAYVALANIYSQSGRTEDSKKIRELMKERGVKKIPGMTTIKIDDKVHSFVSEDTSHPDTLKIYEILKQLHLKMQEAGYVANTSWVTRSDVVDEEEKKRLLCLHSERIAMGFALLKTPERTPITMIKNLRVCGDCHNATKYISIVTGREITVRDANRFHHFTPDGKCSCNDFW